MALGDNNINTTNVSAEIGSSSDTVSGLVGAASLNKFSRYAPGTLSVDANKNVVLTPPTSNYKLGDFRRYTHTGAKPTFQTLSTQLHTPGTTVLTITQPIAMNELNLWVFPYNGINVGVSPNQYHLRCDVYLSSTDRSSETNILQTFYPIAVNMVSHTPLSGHSRQPAYVMNTGVSGNLITLTDVNCGNGTVTRYFDFFFCDQIGANRLINFGNKADGYTDITFRELMHPKITVTGNVTPVPSGSTAAFAQIYTASSPKCSTVSQINHTQGSGSYSFYIGMHAIVGGSTYLYSTTASCSIRMTRGAESQIIASNVAMSDSSKVVISGTLSGWTQGNTFQYDENAVITVENANWATAWGSGSICP
jgi:hypothetical protein